MLFVTASASFTGQSDRGGDYRERGDVDERQSRDLTLPLSNTSTLARNALSCRNPFRTSLLRYFGLYRIDLTAKTKGQAVTAE